MDMDKSLPHPMNRRGFIGRAGALALGASASGLLLPSTAHAATVITTNQTVEATPAHAAACTGCVGLTFDDGPSNAHTPALLNTLRQYGLRATMLNEGQYAAAYPAQVRAEVSSGMWIGNHSYTHPHLTQ